MYYHLKKMKFHDALWKIKDLGVGEKHKWKQKIKDQNREWRERLKEEEEFISPEEN